MTSPDDDGTRPISVAELLAKNGTIGSPPVGGRRRRRRGNADAVTVAELTGEIPIVTADDGAAAPVEPQPEPEPQPEAEPEAEVPAEPAPRPFDGPPPHSSEPVANRERGPERGHDPRPLRRPEPEPAADEAGSDAEHMTFDPVDESPVLLAEADKDVAVLQSYLRSSGGTLFGGETVADDRARRGIVEEDVQEDAEKDVEDDYVVVETATERGAEPPGRRHGGKLAALGRGALTVLQSILAVAFGAGLFVAFDQLWRWNNIVALVLSVLVILGLVVAVRVVRRTEDIASTLIAVAVGALVTLGPLALLQST